MHDIDAISCQFDHDIVLIAAISLSISSSLVQMWVQARRQLGSARSRIQMPSRPSYFTRFAGGGASLI